MIRLVGSPDITFSRDVKPVYRPIPLPGASEEECRQYQKDWGRPVAMSPARVARLSVKLTIEFDHASGATVDELRQALRKVLLESQEAKGAAIQD